MPQDFRKKYDAICRVLTDFEECPSLSGMENMYELLVDLQNFLDGRNWGDFKEE